MSKKEWKEGDYDIGSEYVDPRAVRSSAYEEKEDNIYTEVDLEKIKPKETENKEPSLAENITKIITNSFKFFANLFSPSQKQEPESNAAPDKEDANSLVNRNKEIMKSRQEESENNKGNNKGASEEKTTTWQKTVSREPGAGIREKLPEELSKRPSLRAYQPTQSGQGQAR